MMYLLELQVWSAEAGVAHSPPSDLLWKSQASWGTGNHIVTSLINTDGEVRTSMFDYLCFLDLFLLFKNVWIFFHRLVN